MVIPGCENGRDVAVLQLIVRLQQVGLRNVRGCSAPGCEHSCVKVNRRLFCSPHCKSPCTCAPCAAVSASCRNRGGARVSGANGEDDGGRQIGDAPLSSTV